MLLPYFPFTRRERKRRTMRSSIMTGIMIPLVVLVVVALYIVNNLGVVHATPANGPVPLHGTLPPLLKHSKLNGPTDVHQSLSLAIGLRLRNADVLTNYVKDISRPKSTNYHRYLSPAQFTAVFGPGSSTYNAVLTYLKTAGFTITHTYKHRMLISFKGTVGQVEQTFHVKLNNYTALDGHIFYSNNTDPLVPSSLAGSILSLSGLNNAVQLLHTPLPKKKAVQKKIIHKTTNQGTFDCSFPGGYTPDQMASGYNLNGLYKQGYHGEGQTVALYELDTFSLSDLRAYESCYGQGNVPVQTIVTGSQPPFTDGGVVEVELDAEVVLGVAPGLGQLHIYEAANDEADALAEWAQIVQDAPPVVSTSWGLCEAVADPQAVTQEYYDFAAAAAQGQTIFAASGDTGSAECIRSDQDTMLNVQDPSSQPFITGVGGTTLTLNGDSTYNSETTWNNNTGASGGGLSQIWGMPDWQNAPGTNNQYSNGSREVPDVSLVADPYTGYPIYCTVVDAGCDPNNPWFVEGGTSAAAPMWAAMMALTNEESVKAGGFNIGFLNPLLYQIASSNSYGNDFFDITTGNNDLGYNGGLYPATPVYDMATGLGSYNAANLAADLVKYAANNNGQRSSPTSTTWYFAEGSAGGGFQEYLTLQNPHTTQTANVTITYLIQGNPPSTQTAHYTVSPSSRQTINVDNDLHTTPTGVHYSVAAIVASDIGIVAERPMYFNAVGVQSGTDVVGATHPGSSYYFSEADSTQAGAANYVTFLTFLNPSSSLTDIVTITYYTGSCGGSGQAGCPSEQRTIGPLERQTAQPNDVGLHQKVAIAVTSNNPVVVERPMYFKDNIVNAGGYTSGAASEVGATAPGRDWLFAEGYTGANFQEYFELANFGANDAHTNIILEYTDGSTQTVSVTVPAFGHYQFDVNAQANNTSSVSAEITSDNPIVADRLMYFHFLGSISGGTDVVGTAAANTTYAFAEGYTGGQFSEFLTLQNPTGNDETVAVTLFTEHQLVYQEQVTVVAHSRKTISINALQNPIGPDSLSMTVQALSGVIVAERPMYFNYGGDPGGSDVIGYTGG